MGKIKLKISNMPRQRRVRMVTDALIALKGAQQTKVNPHKSKAAVQFDASRTTITNPIETTKTSLGIGRKIEPLTVKFIVGILIILFSIAGCSDMPYTGSILTVHEVDRYLVSTDGNAVCFQDDLNSTCIKLVPGTRNGADAANPSTIHIYPEKRLYLFYHEGNPILRAERGGHTAQNPQTADTREDSSGDDPSTPNGGDENNNDNNDNDNDDNPDDMNGDNNDNPDDSNDGHGWIIWVYYPEGTAPKNPPTLSKSGVAVTINGQKLTDENITGFAQFIGPNDEKGIQFFYPTESAELLDLKVRMEGIVDAEDTAKFNINYLWKSP